MVQVDEPGIDKRGKKRGEKNTKGQKQSEIAEGIESERNAAKKSNPERPDQCFATIADEPAKAHYFWDVALVLSQPMGGESRGYQNPPFARRAEQQHAQENGVGRPED